MWTVFAALLLLPSPNSQSQEYGDTPPVTALAKDTVRGIVPSVGVALISAARGGGGGGGTGVTTTVNKCWAVVATDHVVSHAPSHSQCHRTGIASGGSRSSATCAVKFTGVSVSGEGGVQEKFA